MAKSAGILFHMGCAAAANAGRKKRGQGNDRSRVVTMAGQAVSQMKRGGCSIRKLALLFLLTEIMAGLFDGNRHLEPEPNLDKSIPKDLDKQPTSIRGLLHVIVLAAANNDDAYAEASAESPAVDALEDDDEDDEELNASASNDYPDGENDESYDDGDDDRQETRITERWAKPRRHLDNSLFTISTS